MKKIFNLILTGFLPVLLVLLSIFVVYKNFPLNSWITGWDNLHPEFNILMNVKRSLNASWQEYQGLGLLGGMGHAADLVRQLVIYGLMYFVPVNLARSVLISFSLILGPLGVYFLLNNLLKDKNSLRNLASFLGGAFYLLNLGTVLNYWVPFEPYYWFFGFLPWLVLSLYLYLKNRSKIYLLIFFVTSLLATPSGYIQTVFIVYSIMVLFLLAGYLIENRFREFRKKIKVSLISLFVIVVTNAFWFLPVIYFSLTHTSVTLQSKANQIATQEVSLSNKTYGNLKDAVLLKGYWLNYYDYNFDNKKFDYLLRPWVDHLNSKNVEIVGYGLFAFVLLGVLYSIFGKIGFRWGLIASLIFGFLMLLGENPPFGDLYKKLETIVPLFSQIFRSPYTKLVIPMSFLYSIFFGLGAAFVMRIFMKVKWGILPSLIFGGALVYGLIFYVRPVFEGNLIYSQLKRDIPSEYFQVFDFFKGQPKDSRIGFFPAQTIFGWNFYNWGARGSGFLWYGIEQPILDRAFDVWSGEDESYYNQINDALYSENLDLFESTLKKYQVKYLLLDENVIEPGRSGEVLYNEKLKELASKSSLIKQTEKFGNITIYKVGLESSNNYISAPTSYSKVDATLDYSNLDLIYPNLTNYVEDKGGVSFPFANLNQNPEISFDYEGENLVIRSGNLNFANKKYLSVPKFDKTKDFPNAPQVFINDKKLEVTIKGDNKTTESFSKDSGFPQAYNCDIQKKGQVSKEIVGKSFVYKAYNDGISCDFLNYGELDYRSAYLLRVKGENVSGRSLRFYFLNWKNQNIEKQELLPMGLFDKTFLISHKNFDGKGYALNLETRSFKEIDSENKIESVEFTPIPLSWISQIKLVPEGDGNIQNELVIKDVKKIGTSHYLIKEEGSGLLVLSQGFDEDWFAYEVDELSSLTSKFKALVPWLFYKPLEHVKVNSWENGWKVPADDRGQILIVFWPQYLEWSGLIFLPIGFLVVLLWPKKKA